MSRTHCLTLALGLAALSAMPTGASARSEGGSDNGDSYLNDSVKNPRFIEPYAWASPSRYRISNPYAGYGDRQALQAYRRGYGRVQVQPYDGYRPY